MFTTSSIAKHTTTAFAASAVAVRDWRGVVKSARTAHMGFANDGVVKHADRMQDNRANDHVVANTRNERTNISFIPSRAFERGQFLV